MAENSNKSETVQRVAWGRRFLAATVVVPPSIGEHLNTDAMAVLAVIRNEAAAIRLAERLGIIAVGVAPDRKRMIINRCVTSRC